MGTRIVFELADSPPAAPDAWDRVAALLREHGAEHVRPPESGPPYIATAVLSKDADVEQTLQALRTAEGVSQAEVDAWRGTL